MLEKITVRIRKKVLGLIEIKGVVLSAKPFLDELEQFRKIKNIKGVVIRVDSPGGGVVPSQEISEAILRTREEKTVVASMGSVAASGGYYIASAAEKIFASPATITGSIGVAMQMRNVEELFTKVGITNAIIKSGQFKDSGSPYRKMTPKEEKYLQEVSDEIYDQFIEAVAKGRRIEREEARKLADGKIYTGRTAKDLGLVDALGGLQTAIKETGKMVGIPGYPHTVSLKRKPYIWSEHLIQAAIKRFLYGWEAQSDSMESFMLLSPVADRIKWY